MNLPYFCPDLDLKNVSGTLAHVCPRVAIRCRARGPLTEQVVVGVLLILERQPAIADVVQVLQPLEIGDGHTACRNGGDTSGRHRGPTYRTRRPCILDTAALHTGHGCPTFRTLRPGVCEGDACDDLTWASAHSMQFRLDENTLPLLFCCFSLVRLSWIMNHAVKILPSSALLFSLWHRAISRDMQTEYSRSANANAKTGESTMVIFVFYLNTITPMQENINWIN